MAEQGAPPVPSQVPDNELIATLAEQIVARVGSLEQWTRAGKTAESALIEVVKFIIYALLRGAVPIGIGAFEALNEALDATADQRGRILAGVLRSTFGVDVSPGDFGAMKTGTSSTTIGTKVTDLMLGALTAGSKSVDPSPEPARRYVEVVLRQALEGWQMGATVELLSGMIPVIEQMQLLGDASSRVAGALGIGDSSSRVLRPYIDTLVVEPLRRHIENIYRPRQLSPSDAVRQYLRGRWSREKAFTELATQGWSDERIEALINGQRKFFGVSDVRLLIDTNTWQVSEGTQHLRDQGYDDTDAALALSFELLKRRDRHEDAMAAAVLNAYVGRDIERAEFTSALGAVMTNDQERGFVLELGEMRRSFNVRRISSSQVTTCVKAGILSVRDYREALEREGYPAADVAALELLLRHELDERARIEDVREQQAADRAAEQQRRAEERARRAAEAQAELELARRGREGDLRRAVVRGLIPVDRLVEVLAARYDADTVAILAESVELDRLQYLEQLQRRDEAAQRAERRAINISDLERAVLAGVLPLVDYRRRLEAARLAPADADLLTRTLEARLDDLVDARRRRDEAERAARNRAIDLGRFEQLVRRGVRSIPQYDALLRELGFGDGARAGMIELLRLQIADDAEARQQRADAEARLRVKGLSLEQFRRGVILGVKTPAEFERFLLEQGFTADAQSVLMADLEQAVEDAAAARRRREAADAQQDARAIPLSTVARAARLGVVSPDVYRARLERDGFRDEDVAIEMELLLLEIADTQAARQRAGEADRSVAPDTVPLSTVARAVRLGLRTLEDYRAAAVARGLPLEQVELLVQVLGAEVRQILDARLRRDQIEAELRPRNLSVAQLEEAVTKQFASIEDFMAEVIALGYAPEDAQLLAALLLHDLEGKGSA
jgi:hypothetical protein